jgi:hypothetical protein
MTSSTDGFASSSSRAAASPAGRTPDFFIVGNPKSGTTALYEALRRHPQIYMPDLKEPWFFAEDMRPRFRVLRSPDPVESLEDYVALFEPAREGQRVGEASSTYLWSRTAAARIAQLRPDARIVAILREPASFLYSLHLEFLQNHVESEKDLLRALALEQSRREGRRIPRRSARPQLLLYSDHVRYVEQLQRYRAVFPPEQMLVLVYDDFRRDNEATVRSVFDFLGVDVSQDVEVTRENVTTMRMRSQKLDDLLNTISIGRGPVSRAAKAVLKTVTSMSMRDRAIRVTQSHLVSGRPEPPDEEVMAELRRRFKGEVTALSAYLGRDLTDLWGYDRLG